MSPNKGYGRSTRSSACLRVYVFPHWADRAFTSIGRSDSCTKRIDYIEDHNGARTADLVRSYLSSIGNWYGERSDDYINPSYVTNGACRTGAGQAGAHSQRRRAASAMGRMREG